MSFFSQWIQLLVYLFAPFAIFTIVIHFIEQIIQRRLSRRFGWTSVMWTGWLGAPIHELSHALMCAVFRHRIEEMALFKPDRNDGRLGYVRHAYQRGNWFEEIGNPFIGIAPIIGGTLVLSGLLLIFFPQVLTQMAEPDSSAVAGESPFFQWLAAQWSLVIRTTQDIFSIEHVRTIRFWIFLYLVLCVASHMAPSYSDYRGAGRGGVLLVFLVMSITALAAAALPDPMRAATAVSSLMAPVFAVLALATALCMVSAIVVFAITAIWDLIVGSKT